MAAGESGCDPNLVKAVIWRESKFEPGLRGKDGEYGLMQIMPSTGKEWADAQGIPKFLPEQLLDPQTNLRAGSWYLAKALQQWSQASEPLPLALAQYNAGRSKVLKWIDSLSLSLTANILSNKSDFLRPNITSNPS
jgi:soluble lytic murein transglycosylase